MNLTELYEQTPVERHSEIVISGDRLFFDNEEYIVRGDGEIQLIHSQQVLEQKVASIETKLGVK